MSEPTPQYRHRTDIPAFQAIFIQIKTQIMAISGESGVSLTKQEKIDIGKSIAESIENIINCFINVSEAFHDYKDKDIERTMQEIKSKENEPIDLKKDQFV